MNVYRLYAGTAMIDSDYNEENIIKSLKECFDKRLLVNYLIIIGTDKGDIIYKIITSEQDYEKYVTSFYENKEQNNKTLVKKK